MCKIQTFVCMAHKAVHRVRITRCKNLVAKGYSEDSDIIWVKTLHLGQEEGCEGNIFSKGVILIEKCPFVPSSYDDDVN